MDDLQRRRNNKKSDDFVAPSESVKIEKPKKKIKRDENEDIVRRLKMRANK